MSCVDVGNPCIFVQASQLGVRGTIVPDEAEAHPDLVFRLESLRRSAAIAMGLATDEASVPDAAPKILMVSPTDAILNAVRRECEGRLYRCGRMVTLGHGLSSHLADYSLTGNRGSS